MLNGVDLDSLTLGEPFTISERGVPLSGVLADGSAFGFDLNTNDLVPGDFFAPTATLTVTLVAEPTATVVPAPTSLALGLVGVTLLARRPSRVRDSA